MPQINIGIPNCKNQTSFRNYLLTSWTNDESFKNKHELSVESKLVIPNADNSDEDSSSQVTENDSGFGAGSDEEDHLNSGLSSTDEYDLNIILESGSLPHDKNSVKSLVEINKEENEINNESTVKNSIPICNDRDKQIVIPVVVEPEAIIRATDSFDFWNKTNKKIAVEDFCDKSSTSVSGGNDNQTSLSDIFRSSFNWLGSSENEKPSVSKKEKLSTTYSCGVPIQDERYSVTDDDSVLNFYDFLKDLRKEDDNKIVNLATSQDASLAKKSAREINPPSYECSGSNNSPPKCDDVYSVLLTSDSLDDNCNEVSNKLNNSIKNSKVNNLQITEHNDTLSDLLASICVESNNDKNKVTTDTVFSGNGLLNETTSDADNEISLAKLAEEYLSSETTNNFLSTTVKDDDVNLLENILNAEKSSEVNLNPLNGESSQGSIDLCDLLASVNKEYDNSERVTCKDNDLLVKSYSDDVKSSIYHPNKKPVALFTEKYINDDSLEDETDDDVEIDLTSCLKSNKLSNPSSECLNIANDKITEADNSDVSHLCYSPTILRKSGKIIYSSPTKSKRTKSKQSLFATALSCKPKKDKSAILQVLSIQKQFCEPPINPLLPPFTVTKKPSKPVVSPASDFVYSTMGRRFFSEGHFSEVK